MRERERETKRKRKIEREGEGKNGLNAKKEIDKPFTPFPSNGKCQNGDFRFYEVEAKMRFEKIPKKFLRSLVYAQGAQTQQWSPGPIL